MGFERFIASRFMPRHGEGSSFSRPLTTIAVAGIALGVVVMVMAISILSGFRRDITQKVVGFGGHLTVAAYAPSTPYTENPIRLSPTLRDSLTALPSVQHAQSFATKGGMVKTDDQIYGILFRGYGEDWDTSFFHQFLAEGHLPQERNDVLISTTIASKLRLRVGDKMRTYFWQGDTYRPRAFTICGLYNTDLSEMDALYTIGHLSAVQKLNDWDSAQIGGLELSVSRLDRIPEAVLDALAIIPYDLMLTTITQQHPALFSWLDLLGANITLLLVIMALVSAVCIISALLIMIFEKSRTIGLLKALGASDASVRRIFLRKALSLVGWGVAIGDIISLILSLLQQHFHLLRLDPESYSMSLVPVDLSLSTYLLVSLGTIAVCLIALLLPTASISRIHPARTIRVEK